MSMKVYDAYKLRRKSDLWKVVQAIQARGRADLDARLREILWKECCRVDLTSEEYKKLAGGWRSPQLARMEVASKHLTERYKKSSVSLERDTYDFDVEVAFWEIPSGVYLQAFCDGPLLRGILDFLEDLPELQEYHYWNNTDRPKDVSAKEWAERRRAWNKIDKCREQSLVLNICSIDSFWQILPWLDMSQEWQKDPPVFPSELELILEDCNDKTLRIEGDSIVGDNTRIHQVDGKWQTVVNGEILCDSSHWSAAASRHNLETGPRYLKEMVQRLLEDRQHRVDSAGETCQPAPDGTCCI